MNKKAFNPEKYNMKVCACCRGKGHIEDPNRQCCPECGGFGYVKKEGEEDKSSIGTAGDQRFVLPPEKVPER